MMQTDTVMHDYWNAVIMGDYHNSYNRNTSEITIKQEPESNNIMITSASVPIPVRRDPPEYRDYIFDLDNSQSPLYGTIGLTSEQALSPSNPYGTYWDNHILGENELLKSEALIHMEEDDIFQVDKADLIQGPTLAELNANDENLLGDLNFDDLLLPSDTSYTILESNSTQSGFAMSNNNQMISASSSCPQGLMFYKELELPSNLITSVSALSPSSSNSSSPMHNLQPKQSTLHDLLMRKDKFESSPDRSLLGHSVPNRNTPLHCQNAKMYRSQASRLSSSAPTHLNLDQIWQRREPRKHLLSTSSLAECGSTSSLSTGGILSPELPDYSHDEYESDEDSDAHYEDYSSDVNSDDDDDTPRASSSSSKKEKFFWQYNIQSKGPKGQRLVMKSKMEDPHVLNEVTDPVFSTDCSVRGIKHSGKLTVIRHSGKARKGDGNDLTPNPRKLYTIGKELDKLGKTINDMTPVNELPFNIRPNSRKEKNKLASRACRLKKKAQHEANKIKLSGLEQEHRRYINTIQQIKHLIAVKLNKHDQESQEDVSQTIDKISKSCIKGKVAGHTTEYVNKVLDKLKAGISANAALSSSFVDDL